MSTSPADLRGADSSGAWLKGCSFATTQLAGLQLSGAEYDDMTRWLHGFEPDSHGAEDEG